MKKYTSGYSFWKKQQQRGVLALLLCCVILQIAYFLVDVPSSSAFSQERVMALQEQIDSLKVQESEKEKQYALSSFNPNFISDYKAYILGISAEELSRLQSFREMGKYVNSAKEFQAVTQVSDSLLATIEPLMKFPDWVTKKKENYHSYEKKTEKIIKKDLNTASIEDLLPVRGIGEKLADRIIKYRVKVQGFSSKKQLSEIYGLSEDVITEVWKYFELLSMPEIIKLNINEVSKKELSKVPYLSYKEVDDVLIFRSERKTINSLDELKSIGFTPEKIEQLGWYLKVN